MSASALLFSTTAATAYCQSKFSFSIEQKPLHEALTEFAQQANTTLLFPYDAVKSEQANALSGDYSVAIAIVKLLEGTRFYPNANADGSISIRPIVTRSANIDSQGNPSSNGKAANNGAAEAVELESIAVVGTRSAPRSVTDSAVPLDILSADMLTRQGSGDMLSMLDTLLPSFNVNDQPINDAAAFVRPANLRGMAPDHTLVLLNGKRHHRSAVITFYGGQISDGAQGPDMSAIPSIALKQIEVLRDGAAAQYGSDAIAGVINFVLKDDAEGGSLEWLTGQYYEGDGRSTQLAGNLGMPFLNTGFANFSFEYRQSDPTSRGVQRDDAAGLIAAGNPYISDPAQIWGSPEVKNDFKLFANIGAELKRNRDIYLFGNVAKREVEGGFYFRHPHTRGGVNDGGLEIADINQDGVLSTDENGNINEGYRLLLVGDISGNMSGNCPRDIRTGDEVVNGETISWGNVLANPKYQALVANNSNCFAFNEMFPGGFTPRFGGVIEDASLAIGSKGVMAKKTNYDLSLYYGANEIDFSIQNTVNPSLGPDSPTSFKPGKYIQSEASLNLDFNRGFEVDFADELFLATGFEYRYEAFEGVAGDLASYQVGPLAQQGFGIGANGFPGLSDKFQGKNSRNSVAIYVDSETHVNPDLMLGAALRYENFSDFGSTTKGKLSARYQISDSVALRAALANGFKAPTIGQSNVRNLTTAFTSSGLADRVVLPPSDSIAIQKGATPLTPEESISFSFGVVGEFANEWLLTIDYFNIKLRDRISTTSGITLTEEDIAALTAQGVDDASTFSEISFFTNDFTTTTQGIDLVTSYVIPMFTGETRLSLAANWTDTQVDSIKAFDIDGGREVEISPQQISEFSSNGYAVNISELRVRMLEDNLPAYRWTFSASHSWGNFAATTRLNYFSETFEDHLDSGFVIDEISAEYSLDVELSYYLTNDFLLKLGAMNSLDERPDENVHFDTEVAGARYPTTSAIGMNGGYYYMRATYFL